MINVKQCIKDLEKTIEKVWTNQNMQSKSCMRVLNSFFRTNNKKINKDDLMNTIKTFSTDFEFIRDEIQRFRAQNLGPEALSVLHPWTYDLDQVDFKHLLSNNLKS